MDRELLDSAMSHYERLRMLEILSSQVLPRLTGDRDLDMQERKLSILTKKRMLGIPESSQEYEDAINASPTFLDNLAPSLTNRALRAIPEPFSLVPHYKVAHSVSDMLPSSVLKKATTGSKYGSRLQRAASFLVHL